MIAGFKDSMLFLVVMTVTFYTFPVNSHRSGTFRPVTKLIPSNLPCRRENTGFADSPRCLHCSKGHGIMMSSGTNWGFLIRFGRVRPFLNDCDQKQFVKGFGPQSMMVNALAF
jgi:hypothetical protein